MISSKPISTSRRKLSILVILALLAFPAWGAGYRTAAVSNDQGYLQVMLSALSLLAGDVTSPEAVEAYHEQSILDAEYAKDSTLSGYRVSESFSSLESYTEPESTEPDEELVLEIAEETFTESEMEYLLDGDRYADEYLRLLKNLDLLVVADVEEEGLMSHSRVYANGDLIHEAIYISSDEAEEFLQLSNALLPYLKNSNTIIIPVDIPRTVSLSIDGEAVSPVNGYIALEKGEHEFSYGSPVYHAAKETVQVDENTVLEPVLVPIFSGPMFIHSVPFDADIYYQGVKVDNHIAGNGSVPFTVTAIRDGFAPYSVQSTVAPYSRVNIELRPAWMGENDMIERSKDRFYSLLLSTLVSFGLQVAANSVSDIFPDWGIAPVGAVFAGISIVQLVELFDSAFDYFQAAKLGM